MRTVQTTVAFVIAAAVFWSVSPLTTLGQDATPTVRYSCDNVTAGEAAGTPDARTGNMTGMDTGTPMAMEMELDQAYIDMMIPHHAGIIALAQAALPRLTDARLQKIAQNVIDAQSAEITELRGYREQWYGSPNPMPMDEAMMRAMMQQMPSMSGTMEEMAFQMDARAQAAAFCAATNPDVAFIDMTIPHHQMAIGASEAAVDGAKHPEIRAFAQRVIDDQQREIEELRGIRQELTGEATPATS